VSFSRPLSSSCSSSCLEAGRPSSLQQSNTLPPSLPSLLTYTRQVGFAGVHSSDGRGAFLILGLFLFFLLVNIACGILRHGSSYLSAWDLVDILLIAAAVWMFHSYLLFNHLATNIRNQWLLSSETAAFMASRAPVLEVPFSLVLFLLVVRLLRHLMIFPILSVPWKTFTRSCKELYVLPPSLPPSLPSLRRPVIRNSVSPSPPLPPSLPQPRLHRGLPHHHVGVQSVVHVQPGRGLRGALRPSHGVHDHDPYGAITVFPPSLPPSPPPSLPSFVTPCGSSFLLSYPPLSPSLPPSLRNSRCLREI